MDKEGEPHLSKEDRIAFLKEVLEHYETRQYLFFPNVL